MNPLSIGTIVGRAKIGVAEHIGVLTGENVVLHNTPTRGEHESTLAEFAAGQAITVKGRVRDMMVFTQRVWRKRQNFLMYDLVSNNCEHTVSALTEDEPISPQLQRWTLAIALTIAIGMLIGTRPK